MKLRRKHKPEDIEAITFEELLEYGKQNGANIVNGMPWSFYYKDTPVTHENDDCYIVGGEHFHRGEMLVSDGSGQPVPFNRSDFDEEYEVVQTEQLEWLEHQARKSPTGISFDYVKTCEGEPSGFRFMRRFYIGQPHKTIQAAIESEILNPPLHEH